ncbi:hypothetical protein Tco_0118304 [Tanacetum coccineum]
MDSIEQCIIERASHEQELKMTLKRLSERQLQIQQCKVQEVQSSITSSGDEEIEKKRIRSTLRFHGKDSGSLTCRIKFYSYAIRTECADERVALVNLIAKLALIPIVGSR